MFVLVLWTQNFIARYEALSVPDDCFFKEINLTAAFSTKFIIII